MTYRKGDHYQSVFVVLVRDWFFNMAENVAAGVAKMNVTDKAWSFVPSLSFLCNVFFTEFSSFSEADRNLVSKDDEYGVFEFLIQAVPSLSM